jgi:hypothetical protein
MQLVTYTTDDGDEIAVQVPDASALPGDFVTRGRGTVATGEEAVQRAEQGLDGALSRIQPAVKSLIGKLRSDTYDPDEIQVEFGIQLSVGVGAFITAGTTSNFRVLMTWSRRADPVEEPDEL